jgi:hypothetical protein
MNYVVQRLTRKLFYEVGKVGLCVYKAVERSVSALCSVFIEPKKVLDWTVSEKS